MSKSVISSKNTQIIMSNTPLHIYAQFLLCLSCAYSVNTEQTKMHFLLPTS
uniref:Uncharacterized protein n=1 Tax=Anguilla anguilla TaxID=7936 RepID=A0A0E9R4K6_ANGAN